MKILLVVDSHFREYGGPHTAISDKIRFLNKHKIKNKLIYSKNNFFNYRIDIEFIVKDYDIVHIYGIWRPFLIKVFYIAKKLNKKIVISPIGALEPWSLSQKKIKKKLALFVYQKRVLNQADAIHATSEIEAKNLILNNLGKKIKIIGHGIEIDNKYFPKKIKGKLKKLIFFSRIHEKKGLIELLRIWNKLKFKNNWQLEIYGPVSNATYYKNILNFIKNQKLEKEIKVLGSVFDEASKKKIFSEATAFILPSKSENFGISIGEALSHGLPVLTTFQTPWKIINDYKAGYVFDFSEENILHELDKFMSLNSEQVYKMSLNALNLVKDNFEYNSILSQYVKLYKELLS